MPVQHLIREYEERKRALIKKLQSDRLDTAVQHQIYGAIQEIETFLKSLEVEAASTQDIGIELARDKPRPLREKTKKIAGRMKRGTKKVAGKMKIGAKKAATAPKRFLKQRREKKRMKEEIERELLSRMQRKAALSGSLPSEVREDVRSQRLPDLPYSDMLTPTGATESALNADQSRREAEPVREPRQAPKKPPKKPRKKTSKKR